MHIEINPATINAFDRLAHYGDGCFTTAAFSQGNVQYLEAHLARLNNDAKTIGLSLTADDVAALQNALISQAQKHHKGVLKVLLSSGLSVRGYQRTDNRINQAYIFVSPEVAHYHNWREQGIQLAVGKMPLSDAPAFARIKHVNRLEQTVIKAQIPHTAADVLVVNDRGHMIETSAANVFFKYGNCWFTPELHNQGIEGVMRNRLVTLLPKHGEAVQELSAGISFLENCSDMFICNSLMRVVPVTNIMLENSNERSSHQDVRFANTGIAKIQQLIEDDIAVCS